MSRATIIAIGLAIATIATIHDCDADPIAAQVDAASIIRSTRQDAPRASTRPEMTPEAHRATPALILAVVGWSEAGSGVTAGELAAMHEVLTSRMSERTTYQRRAWAYSAGLRHPRHGWLLRTGGAPLGDSVPARVRVAWDRVLHDAARVIAGDVQHGCDASPLEHWGGPDVDRHAIRTLTRRGWVRVTCPVDYANAFLVREVTP